MYKRLTQLIILLTLGSAAYAKNDLAVVPKRKKVQLTIYNSADLTLVRETRYLTLKKGDNKLEFSWVGTLIDPTSLEIKAAEHADKISVTSLTFPPRVKNTGVWVIKSQVNGEVPFEITYFTSKISWRAFYMATLSKDESKMRLQGYVRVDNQSGEDYTNAQTRMVVGEILLEDEIEDLADVRPFEDVDDADWGDDDDDDDDDDGDFEEGEFSVAGGIDPKEIMKKGLSEYQLFTVEGREDLKHGWAKRLPSFDVHGVPVESVYKFEYDGLLDESSLRRFIRFLNDKDSKLGEAPIPEGTAKVYGTAKAGLQYVGEAETLYIPVAQKAEWDLGTVEDVIVERRLLALTSGNYRFDHKGNLESVDKTSVVQMTVKNTRPVPITVEITIGLVCDQWTIANGGDFGVFEKLDKRRIRYTLRVPPRSQKVFSYKSTVQTPYAWPENWDEPGEDWGDDDDDDDDDDDE